MVAFCVIVGDTVPKVMSAFFPSLASTSFLWLLTDRRAVMILLILGISYPLSLYRDIAKVTISPAPPMAPIRLTHYSSQKPRDSP
jgi:sodium-coupled neutral amino acid transporter 11